MGYGMASHLLRAGYPVTGYDIHPPSMLRLVAEGGASANSPRDAAPGADVVLVMVANQAQVTALLFDPATGAADALKAHATVVLCSTVAPAYVVGVGGRLGARGRGDVGLVDCPVSGGAGRAAGGTLSVFAAGADGALFAPHVQSILACLSGGRKLYHVPGGLGAGSKAKLVHQVFAGVHIAVACEAMGLAAAAGLDTKRVFEEVCAGAGASWMFGHRVPFMLEAGGEGRARYSAVGIIAKDVGIVMATAREERFPLPLVGVAEQLYSSAIGAGWGGEDDCVVVRLYLLGRPELVVERAGRAAVGGEGAGAGGGICVSDVEDLLVGVHVAVMSEAMAFCEMLGIDAELMYDIVSNAAGASRIFQHRFREMRKGGWGLKGVEGVEGIRERLVSDCFWPLPLHLLLSQTWVNELMIIVCVDERGGESCGAEIPVIPLLGGVAGVPETVAVICRIEQWHDVAVPEKSSSCVHACVHCGFIVANCRRRHF